MGGLDAGVSTGGLGLVLILISLPKVKVIAFNIFVTNLFRFKSVSLVSGGARECLFSLTFIVGGYRAKLEVGAMRHSL